MEKLLSTADGWIVNAGTFAIFVTSGRIGWTYFERPHEIEAA